MSLFYLSKYLSVMALSWKQNNWVKILVIALKKLILVGQPDELTDNYNIESKCYERVIKESKKKDLRKNSERTTSFYLSFEE